MLTGTIREHIFAVAPLPAMHFRDSLSSMRRRGFTLVEILVVLILIGLMIGLVAPAVIPPRANDDPTSRLRQLVRSSSAAAVKRGEIVRLTLHPTGDWEVLGIASAPPDSIAAGRLDISGLGMTLLFSPLGTCSPDFVSEKATAPLGFDLLTCDFRVAEASP
jgi:prepilin-type N-terminal cleavage/methylation domain-containing protein